MSRPSPSSVPPEPPAALINRASPRLADDELPVHIDTYLFILGIGRRASANIALTSRLGGSIAARVITTDATRLPRNVPISLHGRFRLVLTAPPDRRTMHRPVGHWGPLARFHNRYGPPNQAILARRRQYPGSRRIAVAVRGHSAH
jgi:hypothetical protein